MEGWGLPSLSMSAINIADWLLILLYFTCLSNKKFLYMLCLLFNEVSYWTLDQLIFFCSAYGALSLKDVCSVKISSLVSDISLFFHSLCRLRYAFLFSISCLQTENSNYYNHFSNCFWVSMLSITHCLSFTLLLIHNIFFFWCG